MEEDARVTSEPLEPLPERRRDEEITADLLDVLWFSSDLDVADLEAVGVHTTDGIVELRGLVGTERARATIEAIARGVRGVRGVQSRLETVEQLEAAAAALEQTLQGRRGQPPTSGAN